MLKDILLFVAGLMLGVMLGVLLIALVSANDNGKRGDE